MSESANQDMTTGPRGPVALVYSPHAGSAGHVHPVELLASVGLTVAEAIPISELDVAPRWMASPATRWRQAGCVAVVAAGGDGTVGAVATHAAIADIPLGILPLGTANDIARSLGIPEDLEEAARIIARGESRLIDAGQAIPSLTEPQAWARGKQPYAGGEVYFLHALTLGFNVEFARLATSVEQRRRWGPFTYAASAIESLSHFKPTRVTLAIGGEDGEPAGSVRTLTEDIALLAAINLPVFGGWMGLRVPNVRADDHMLDFLAIHAADLTHVGVISRAIEEWVAAFTRQDHGSMRAGGLALPGGQWFRARSVEIHTDEPVDVTLDGELRGRTPMVARVAPKLTRVLAPPTQGITDDETMDASGR